MKRARERYPSCTIANCNCNSREGEWQAGCHCLCHFAQMDEIYPTDWNLNDFNSQAKEGIPSK